MTSETIELTPSRQTEIIQDESAESKKAEQLSIEDIVKNTAHLVEGEAFLIQWIYTFAEDRDWSLEKLARESGISASTLYRIWTDKYRDAKQERISVTQICDRISRFQKEQEKRESLRTIPFLPTQVYRDIRELVDETRTMQCIGIIYGDGQIGKSESMINVAIARNYGLSVPDTLYVRCSAQGGVMELVDRIAKVCRVNPKWTLRKKVAKIKKFLGPSKVLMIDETHLLFETYAERVTKRAMELLRELHDETKCGLVICGTNVFRDEIRQGDFKKMLKQLTRRGIYELQLPDVAPREDLDTIAKYFGLPPAPVKSPAEDVMLQIAEDDGLGKYIKFLTKASNIAATSKQKMTWDHFTKAYKETAARAVTFKRN